MSPMTGLRVKIVRLALAVALVWPMCQMALTRWYGMSTWRLGGWGMYATPHESRVTVHIYLTGPDGVGGVQRPPGADNESPVDQWLTKWAPRGPLAVFVINSEKVSGVRLSLWSTVFARDVGQLVRAVQSFRDEGSIRRLMLRLIESEDAIRSAGAAVVVIGKPRLSVAEGWKCMEKDVYVFKKEAVNYVGRFVKEGGWMDAVRRRERDQASTEPVGRSATDSRER